MTSARDDILARIRSACDSGGGDRAQRRAIIEQRLATPPRHVVPARAREKSPAERAVLLRHYLEGQSAVVLDAPSMTDVPRVISGWLGAPATLRMGDDPVLAAMPWATAEGLTITQGRANGSDGVGVSRAVAGIAETGTLVLLSGPDNPVTLAFLPETHVIVLSAAHLVGSYEEALGVVRGLTKGGGLPRTINLVSGPSRTADIIGILVTGAHGPRRLAVVLVDAPEAEQAVR